VLGFNPELCCKGTKKLLKYKTKTKKIFAYFLSFCVLSQYLRRLPKGDYFFQFSKDEKNEPRMACNGYR
jgi:hypothetical protein